MDWAAWGPTIVSIITCIFFAGVLWANQSTQSKRLDDHDTQLEEHSKGINEHSIQIGKLEAFHKGYESAMTAFRSGLSKEL
jgi:hypothetical protein